MFSAITYHLALSSSPSDLDMCLGKALKCQNVQRTCKISSSRDCTLPQLAPSKQPMTSYDKRRPAIYARGAWKFDPHWGGLAFLQVPDLEAPGSIKRCVVKYPTQPQLHTWAPDSTIMKFTATVLSTLALISTVAAQAAHIRLPAAGATVHKGKKVTVQLVRSVRH